MNDFVDHFKSISNTPHNHLNIDNYTHSREDTIVIDQLDMQFSIDEIIKTIS